MWLNKVIYEERTIEDERLELTDKNTLYFLGHNLVLRRCSLVFRVPAERLHITRTRFIDCHLEARSILRNFQWVSAHLKGCRFTGRFSGNDFGPFADKPDEGSIEDCDFTEARLNWCRFLGCDARSLRLPSWPCFTIYEPASRVRELTALSWPGRKGRTFAEGFADDPPSTSAVTFEALEMARWCETTPDALRAVVEKLEGVYY